MKVSGPGGFRDRRRQDAARPARPRQKDRDARRGAALAHRIPLLDDRRMDGLARRERRRPRRPALGRLPQGERRDPRPDRAHDGRAVVSKLHQAHARGRVLFPLTRRRIHRRVRHVDRRGAGRGRHRREATGPCHLRGPSCASAARTRGLLEWSGGNLFKARVFPIEPHSEKRIRIRYTQVLPLEGSKLRYRYALRSELLRSRPLRDLQINISVVLRAMPIKAVSRRRRTRCAFATPRTPRGVRRRGVLAGPRLRAEDRARSRPRR